MLSITCILISDHSYVCFMLKYLGGVTGQQLCLEHHTLRWLDVCLGFLHNEQQRSLHRGFLCDGLRQEPALTEEAPSSHAAFFPHTLGQVFRNYWALSIKVIIKLKFLRGKVGAIWKYKFTTYNSSKLMHHEETAWNRLWFHCLIHRPFLKHSLKEDSVLTFWHG